MCKFGLHTVVSDEPSVFTNAFLEDMVDGIAVVGEMADDLHRLFVGSADGFELCVQAADVINAHVTALIAEGKENVGAVEADAVKIDLFLCEIIEDFIGS